MADNQIVVSNRALTAEMMTGTQKAAAIMLALGEDNGKEIWQRLGEEEVRDISVAMAQLGGVNPETFDGLMVDFVTKLSSNSAMTGNFDTTEKLLASFLPDERVALIMEEIRGPAGRNMWEKLGNVQENVLANYLKNEYPQTIAVVLSKISVDHAARVLTVLPDELALEVVHRMLAMESVQKEILEKVEETLRSEFMSNLTNSSRRDSHELMAEIFNNFDRQTEARFLTALEEDDRDSAERIKSLMFTFDDLGKMDAASVQTLLRQVEKDVMTIALKGAGDAMREFFFSNMSQRASKMLQDDMEALGPLRLSDVDEAQTGMVNMAKDLAEKGEIVISKGNQEEEMIY